MVAGIVGVSLMRMIEKERRWRMLLSGKKRYIMDWKG